MTFSGDLNGINLADVFQNIHANRATGTLLVESRAGERYVFFREGMIAAFSLGRGKGLPIAEQLVKRGLVNAKRMAAMTRKRKSSRRLLRTLLAEAGDLSEEQFRDTLGTITSEHIYELMRLREARFEFTEGEAPPRVFDTETKATQLRLDPSGVLMESARRMDEWERIQRVISSEHDLFVLLEGWDELELDAIGAAVAALLDGSTSVRGIEEALPYPRFGIWKAISDLVLQGGARPCKADEIDTMIKAALADDNVEQAVGLMTRALALERNNRDLRSRLVDLLERLGRHADAASECALLGYQAAQENDYEKALAYYERAARLNPDDLMLHERRLDLLRRTGPLEEQIEGVISVIDLLLARGLADRARTVLRGAMESKALRRDTSLTEKLAEVEAALGNQDQASDLLLQAADSVAASNDEERALVLMRKALVLRGDDEALARRIDDLASGAARRRSIRRRRRVAAGVAAVVVLALGIAGVMEITAAHRLLGALDSRIESISGGHPVVAVEGVQGVREGYGWTWAGRRAEALADRLVDAQLREVEAMRTEGKHAQALRLLEEFGGSPLPDNQRRRVDALLDTARLEHQAHELLVRANRVPPDDDACQALAKMVDVKLLAFHRDNLRWARPRAQRSMLRALRAIDDPAAVVPAARLFVASDDQDVRDLAQSVLDELTARHAGKGDKAWAEVYPELEKALGEPAFTERAREALHLLKRGQAK